MTRYVIIGDGGAGTTAAYYIRQADPAGQIEIYSDDPNAAYYRAALTNYLIGELREAQLFATPPDFYQTNTIQRAIGRVASLDGKNSRLTLEDGTAVSYDQLLIAAGASPNPPSFPGSDLPGVMTMRTLQDARTVMDLVSAKRLKQAVVVGGGPLGIEWVQGLLHHRVRVTYLLRGDMFFEKALDRTASDLVISRLREAGVDVRTNEEIGEAIAGRDRRLRAIRLKHSGDPIECQLVGAAIGIRPNVDFLNGSGVDVAVDEKRGTPQGIKVDEAMRTNIPNIHAAGDIIHRTLGLWEPARLQGRVAGRNMAGGSEVFRRNVHYNATRLYDLDFAGTGEPLEKSGDEVLIDYPRGSGSVRYRKLIIREGKLVGAVLLGHRREQVRKYGMAYRDLIEMKTDISSVSKDLLDPFFDLAAWLDSHKIGDQIESVRNIREAPKTPTFAALRQTRHELGTGVPRSPVVKAAGLPEAELLSDGKRIPIKAVTRIGRRSENDLVLNDPDVSGRHARIRFEDSAFLLEDLKSTNGTFLNGERISAPVRLATGSQIQVGGTQLQFVIGSSTPVQNLRMTSAGLPEAPPPPSALPTDPVWGTLQIGAREIPLRMLVANIGRDPKTDIPLDDPTISFTHAQFVRQGSDSYLRDLGSSNGTFVNGERISVPHRLEHGDVITLGDTEIAFRMGAAPAPKAGVTPEAKEEARIKAEAPTLVDPGPIQPPVKEETPVSPKTETVPAPEKPLAAGAPMLLSIRVLSGSLAGRTFPLNQSPITVGRDPASHISISDETTSWRHAMFKQEDMKWFIRDLGSSNGTFLNDKHLEANQPHPIQAGDRLKFGDTLLEVTHHAG